MCTLIRYLGFMGTFFNTHLYCLIGCLSMIVWTNAVLGVVDACVLYFCICTCSAQLSMFHMKGRSRNALIIIIIIVVVITTTTAAAAATTTTMLISSGNRNTLVIIVVVVITTTTAAAAAATTTMLISSGNRNTLVIIVVVVSSRSIVVVIFSELHTHERHCVTERYLQLSSAVYDPKSLVFRFLLLLCGFVHLFECLFMEGRGGVFSFFGRGGGGGGKLIL